MNIIIRQPSREELGAVTKLQTDYLKNFCPFYNREQLVSLIVSETQERLTDKQSTFIAEYENQIFGVACFDLETQSITSFYIQPGFMSKEVAGCLLNHIEKLAASQGLVYLKIWSLLDAYSDRFYERCGYRCILKTGFYVKNNVWIPCLYFKKQIRHLTWQEQSKNYYRFFVKFKSFFVFLSFCSISIIVAAVLPMFVSR